MIVELKIFSHLLPTKVFRWQTVDSHSSESQKISSNNISMFRDSEEDFIGLGGFGVVFRGKDEIDGKEVSALPRQQSIFILN